jgi:hypothetical protein
MIRSLLLIIASVASLGACGTSRVSMPPATAQKIHSVKVDAFASGGGVLADAVAVELANRGYCSATIKMRVVRQLG